MRSSIYLLRLLLACLACLALMKGCGPDDSGQPDSRPGPAVDPVLYVSEALPNRTHVDTTIVPFTIHGSHCDGFLDRHFDATRIGLALSSPDVPGVLERETGLRWSAVATADSIIDFTRHAARSVNGVVYLAEAVDVKAPGLYTLSLGSDDGVSVFVDGDSIYSHHVGRELRLHSDLIPLKLDVGRHSFLYKVDQGDGGWSLYRRLMAPGEEREILQALVPEMYADLPESSVLPDGAGVLPLRPDHRRRADGLHTVSFVWSDLETGRRLVEGVSRFPAPHIPDTLLLPEAFDGSAEITVRVATGEGTPTFAERHAVFSRSTAARLARRLSTDSGRRAGGAVGWAQREAVRSFIGLHRTGRAYSTRLLAEAIAEARRADSQRRYPRPLSVRGYRGAGGVLESYRVFVPSATTPVPKALPIAFVSYGIKGSSSLWGGKEAASHYLTARRSALATYYGLLIALPHGRTKEAYAGDFSHIAGDLVRNGLACDSTATSVLAYSGGMTTLLEAMASREMPFLLVGGYSPIFPAGETRRYWFVERLRRAYPGLRWFLRSGLDDPHAPIQETRRWVQALRDAGFSVDYQEVPHASHWSFPLDPEPAFFRLAAEIGACSL